MPVIGIQTDLLLERLGAHPGQQELIEHLQHLGCDVEGYTTLRRYKCARCGNITETVPTQDAPVACERCGVDYRTEPGLLSFAGEVEVLRMELLAVRPDMFDPGGLARMLRAYLGLAKEPPRYPLSPPRLSVVVDPLMSTPRCPRPAIACAVVRNVKLTDDLIKVVMKLQENLHWALGRDRKHASIGVYDLDTIDASRPLHYRPVGPDELRFVPLGYSPDSPAALLTPRQVLEQHPKGTAYAHLLAGWELYPLLHDADGRVLSMPPIINSEQTRVQLDTRTFFIDVTGTERRIVGRALNVLVTSLLELAPGVELEAVNVLYPGGEVLATPDLTPQRVTLDVAATARLIGIPLDDGEAARLLERMGHQVTRWQEGKLEVAVPAYRNDILHPCDLMEDVAIAFGYHEIPPRLLPTLTVGQPQPIEEWSDRARQALTGLGLQEVITLQLSSPEVAYDALRLPRREDHVAIANPISVEETMPRVSLLPGLLQTLQKNVGRELPQRIFEIGDVTLLDPEAETGAREHRHAAASLAASQAGFAELRSLAEALLAELSWGLATEPVEIGTFLPGRCARLVACRGDERREVGQIGEVHPEVLDRFHLRYPTVAFEVDLGGLLA